MFRIKECEDLLDIFSDSALKQRLLTIFFQISGNKLKTILKGCLDGSTVERLPSAQVVIPKPWDRVPHGAPCMEPASPPSACVSASLCVSDE